MTVILPTTSIVTSVIPRPVTSRNNLSSTFGGADQRINRMGSKWALDVVMAPMTYEESRDWEGLETDDETCVFEVPEPGVNMDGCGSPLVKGAGQSGMSLITDGWTPQSYIPKGKWITVAVSGLLYLYRTRSAVVADASGEATLPIRPMLRRSPADNAALSVNPAKIEGFATVPEGAFEISGDQIVHGLRFTLTERR